MTSESPANRRTPFLRLHYLRRVLHAYVIRKNTGNLSFWHTPLKANALDEEDLRTVRRYPMNFAAKTAYNAYRDRDGVIMLNYYGRLGLQYNPNAIAQQALGYYDLHLEHPDNPEHVRSFLAQSRWFLKHGRHVSDGVLLWEYRFPWEGRRFLTAPWRSALAQGQAISVLLRAHRLSGDNAYLEAARRGYNAFRYTGLAHEGGVVSRQNGCAWLEEVIYDPPNHILNGFVWALWGVRDYAVFTNDPHARQLYQDCLRTLEANLCRYDLGFWTCYDLIDGWPKREPVMPASIYYQELHATQMLACFRLTGKKVFRDFYRRWTRYLRSPWRRAVSQLWKSYFKLRYF